MGSPGERYAWPAGSSALRPQGSSQPPSCSGHLGPSDSQKGQCRDGRNQQVPRAPAIGQHELS